MSRLQTKLKYLNIMKRFFALLLIGAVIITVLLFFTNPSLLDEIWLWLIGFLGSIIGFFRNIFDKLKDAFSSEKETNPNANTSQKAHGIEVEKAKLNLERVKYEIERNKKILEEEKQQQFNGTTITVIRFTHDEDTTLGLLYINNTFNSYTLEDTYRKQKILGETRIPAGTYEVDFLREDTGMTLAYRNGENYKFLRGIFSYHIEIKNIPNYTKVYLHVGNNHEDTKGCILIADGIQANSERKMITSSRKAYLRFYKHISSLLENGDNVRILIKDEGWIKNLKS